MLTVKIISNEKGNPPGKLADAELHFVGPTRDETREMLYHVGEHPQSAALAAALQQAATLDGLKLVGFGIWERRTGGGRNVTFPARQYSVNGERRAFSLLRPIGDTDAQARIRDLILCAYADYEANDIADAATNAVLSR